jgi:hypothetical protein
MTTHELARVLTHLRDGFGASLRVDAVTDLTEAATALQALPDKALRDLAKDMQTANGGVQILAERLRAAKGDAEPANAVLALVQKLKAPELKELVKALGQPSRRTMAENHQAIQAWLGTSHAAPAAAANGHQDDVEAGYRLYCQLRDNGHLSIDELRQRFQPIAAYPKTVIEAVAAKLGYRFEGNKQDVANRLLQTLEGLYVSRARADLIGVAR